MLQVGKIREKIPKRPSWILGLRRRVKESDYALDHKAY